MKFPIDTTPWRRGPCKTLYKRQVNLFLFNKSLLHAWKANTNHFTLERGSNSCLDKIIHTNVATLSFCATTSRCIAPQAIPECLLSTTHHMTTCLHRALRRFQLNWVSLANRVSESSRSRLQSGKIIFDERETTFW